VKGCASSRLGWHGASSHSQRLGGTARGLGLPRDASYLARRRARSAIDHHGATRIYRSREGVFRNNANERKFPRRRRIARIPPRRNDYLCRGALPAADSINLAAGAGLFCVGGFLRRQGSAWRAFEYEDVRDENFPVRRWAGGEDRRGESCCGPGQKNVLSLTARTLIVTRDIYIWSGGVLRHANGVTRKNQLQELTSEHDAPR